MLPKFGQNGEYEWSHTYLNVLLAAFPAAHRPVLNDRQKVISLAGKGDGRTVCFRRAVG